MTDQKFPFVSVVIATFNRGSVISACLESLNRQTYPKDRYEVIVVDDCSTDNTAHVAQAHLEVQVIGHAINKGTAAARNTGIAAAKGEIVAFIDDDAIADPVWLEYLMRPFADPNITATGGQTFAYKTDYIAERYLSASGYGNPAPLAFGKSKNPLWRFWIYLKDMFSPVTVTTAPKEVQAVFGLNCAFRASTLRAVGGFDEKLLSAEDSEISTRLRKEGARIMFIPDAIIYHRHRESLKRLIWQTYYRTEYLLYYYAKEKKALPIFPFPLLYVVIIVFLLVFPPIVGFLFIILGPLLLYSWWPIKALRERRTEYFFYAYIQLMLEMASNFGLVRGKFRQVETKTI